MPAPVIGSDVFGPPVAGPYRIPRPGTMGGFHFQRTPTHQHQGVDLSVAYGTPWLAIADGVIEHAHSVPTHGFGGYGRVVVLRFVDRDGKTLRALYAHGSAVDVAQGSTVRKGDKLGRVGRSQFRGGNAHDDRGPTGPGMGAHLHHEIATRPYYMRSEAPFRLDPWGWYRDRGVPLEQGGAAEPGPAPAEPVADEDAQPSSPRAPGHMAKQQVRSELMTRLVRTQIEVSIAVAQLRAAGSPRLAEGLRASWAASERQLLPLLRNPSPLEDVQQAVRDWLTQIDVTRSAAEGAARGASSAALQRAAADAAALAARQHEMWEAGDWLNHLVDALEHFALNVGVGLLVVVGAYLWFTRKKG